MKLNYNEYKDKVYACWVGKNIGGTMGTPYEGQRSFQNISGFVTKPNEVLPNDDLDLQLVWLHAVEQIGPYGLDCKKLGEFWLNFITPYWNEYGIGKNNMRRGMYAPLSGDFRNSWRDSNGAWIRTEVWASMAPGCPEVAAKYAIEDAKVDHGAGEGTYAAAFVAAMQSAAFVEKDIMTLVEIGLCYIPENCRLAQSIRLVIDCYNKKIPAPEARNMILEQNADIGDGWFEAPSNVAYTVLGLLYGEGDFKKSMITAINCGDDTDCTGATVGSTLGIIGGLDSIPADWRSYIGDSIVTISIPCGVLYGLPKTCTELTERVVRQAPIVLHANKRSVEFTDGENEIPAGIADKFKSNTAVRAQLDGLKPFSFNIDADPIKVQVNYLSSPEIEKNGELKAHISFVNKYGIYGSILYNLNLRWILPEGFTVEGCPASVSLPHFNAHCTGISEYDITIKAGDKVEANNRVILEVTFPDRPTSCYVPFVIAG